MEWVWIDTAEGVTLVAEDGAVRGATPIELELRKAGVRLASYVEYLVGEKAPPERVMDAIAVFTGEDESEDS